MRVDHVPLLTKLRALYSMPRDMKRFHEYVREITGGTDDVELAPLIAANPMAKPHVAERIDELLACGAEDAAAEAAREGERRLAGVDLALRVGLTVADDVAGGWTDRHLTDAQHRFENEAGAKRGWATAVLWASEPASAAAARRAVLLAVHRTADQRTRGWPRTLRERMAQEGRALAFAGVELPPVDFDGTRRTLAPHLDSRVWGVTIAAMYGDAVARKCGFEPLGVPAWGGFAVALADETRPQSVR